MSAPDPRCQSRPIYGSGTPALDLGPRCTREARWTTRRGARYCDSCTSASPALGWVRDPDAPPRAEAAPLSSWELAAQQREREASALTRGDPPEGYSAETAPATWIRDGARGRQQITPPVLTFLADPEGTERAYDHRAEAVGAALQMEAQNMPYTARDSDGQVVHAATVEELTAATTAAQRSEFASWTVRETDSEAPGGSRYVGYINGGLLISAEQMDAGAEAHVDDQAAAFDGIDVRAFNEADRDAIHLESDRELPFGEPADPLAARSDLIRDELNYARDSYAADRITRGEYDDLCAWVEPEREAG